MAAYNYRIKDGTKWLMLLVASIIDAVEVILNIFGISFGSAWFSGAIQYGIFWGWFKIYGVSFFKKKVGGKIGAMVAESIPIIEALPIFTWSVWSAIKDSRTEDEQNQQQQINETVIRVAKNRQNQIASQNRENIIRAKNSSK